MSLTAAVYHIGGVTVPRAWLSGSHVYDMRWAADRLANLEPHVAKPLAKTYLARYAVKPRSAAIWLRNMSAACLQAADRFPVPPHELRNELRRDMIAAEWAGRCKLQLAELTASGSAKIEDSLKALAGQAKAWHFCPPLPKAFDKKAFIKDVEERKQALLAGVAGDKREAMSRAFDESNSLADADSAVDLFEQRAASIMVRLLDEGWWRRRIARAWDVYCELIAIFTGQVRKGVSPYASHHARREHLARKAAQQRWAEGRKVVNEQLGQEVELLEAMMASVSNPMIRRCELMVRMRGFEEIAKESGHMGLFVTLTAPSQYHAWKQAAKSGKTFQNDKYNGATPTETQRMLCQQWAQFRAAIARLEIKCYGFRIAEPHHDATPHWHALFFVHPDQQDAFLKLLTFYFTQRDRFELGMPNTEVLDFLNQSKTRNKALKAMPLIDIHSKATLKAIKPRVAWEVIDESKGSATGYIAKYVAKNIDGHRVGWDEEAEEAVETSTTGVAAWASRHRIRQFQQIGGPSVTVWRELRRLRDNIVEWDEVLELARAAVNGARWGDFIEAMGGIMTPRKEHLVKLSKVLEPEANKYGEDRQRLLGVMSAAQQQLAQTRFEGWEIVKKGSGSGVGFGERSELHSSGGSRAPRSSVNNCTYGSLSLEKGSALVRELSRMGLNADELTLKLLGRGSIVSFDGRYVRLAGDRLIVSQSWPGATDGKANYEHLQHDTAQAAELAKRQAERETAVRQQVKQTIDTGADIEDLIASLPLELAELALAEATRLIDMAEYTRAYQPSPQEIARCDALRHSNDQHQPAIAEALAERELDKEHV